MHYADSQCTYHEVYEDGKHFYIFQGPCVVTGELVTVRIPGRELYNYRHRGNMAENMPSLSIHDREFLISGLSQRGWDETFSVFDEVETKNE